MEDDDDQDFSDNVVRQAWISYWQLTGLVIIPDEFQDSRRFFTKVPPVFADEETMRVYLFSISHANPQISKAQVDALDFCTLSRADGALRKKDPGAYDQVKAAKLKQARKVAEGMRNQIDGAIARWDAAEKKGG